MNNRILTLLFAAVSLAGTASAGFVPPYSCTGSSDFPVVRPGGLSELVGDVVIVCTGGSFSTTPPQNVTISMNAPITSGLFPVVGTVPATASEALLLINEPSFIDGGSGSDLIRGTQLSANSIRFNGVSIYPPGGGQTRIYRITNVRVDASLLPTLSPIQMFVSVSGSVPLASGPFAVGIVERQSQFDVRTCNDSQSGFMNFQQATSQNPLLANGSGSFGGISFNVRFTAPSATFYRRRIAPNQDPSTLGVNYNSESGYVNTGIIGDNSGAATQGTRMISRFTNLPAGVRLFVTTQPIDPGGASSSTLQARLIATDTNGAGPFTLVPSSGNGNCANSGVTAPIAEIPIVGGVAQAVWEVIGSSPTAVEKASFGVVVAYTAAPPTNPGVGTASAGGTFGPISTIATASLTAPRPRYVGTTTTVPAFAIVVPPPLLITTATPLPSGQVGVAYQLPAFAASGGVGTFTWSATSVPAIPPGLAVAPTGTFTGIPTLAGNYTFTVQVQDQASATATKTFTINIAPPPFAITTASPLPSAQVGVAYTLPSFTASNGTAPLTWSLVGSSAPPGLILSPIGAFAGNPTTQGSYSFTVQVRDQLNAIATKTFALTVSPPPQPVSITTASPLPSGQVGAVYSLPSFTAAGGVSPYTWSFVQPSVLPSGFILNSSSGSFDGTPTTAGTSTFTIKVTDANGGSSTKQFTLTIASGTTPPAQITTASPLPPARVGTPYSVQFAQTGVTVQFTQTATPKPILWFPLGELPAGLAFDNPGPNPPGEPFISTGLLSGIPTTPGTYSFGVQVTNRNNGVYTSQVIDPLTNQPFPNNVVPLNRLITTSTTKYFLLTVNAQVTLTVNPSTVPTGTVGATYSQQFTATDGIGPYTFSVSSGTLPLGLSLTPGGLLSGTLLTQGTSAFSVSATDSIGNTGSRPISVSAVPPLVAPDSGVSITTRQIPNGAVGVDYTVTLAATGGFTPYTWSADIASLPPGVTLSSAGVLSGRPTRAGAFRIILRVADTRGNADGTVFPITITGSPLSITTTLLAGGTVGVAYSGSVQAAGGISPYAFTVSAGSLPAGLSLSADGGISGTPTAAGTFNFTVQATDAAQNPQGSVTKTFSIVVAANPPSISTTSLPNGVINIPYTSSVAATGGLAPYTFTVSAGSLPPGLTLSPAGNITGTPTAIGDFNVTIQVTDSQRQTATRAFPIRIVPAVTITTNSPLGLLITGATANLTLAATGGTLPYSWAVTAGSLPAGVNLDATSGALAGSPTTAGSYNFTATVTDANRSTATRAFTGRVVTPVRITTTSPLTAGIVGTAYTQSIAATGGTTPYRFSASSLPAGLAIDASTGVISGTPTGAAAGSVTATVTDADNQTATANLALTIALPQLTSVTIGGVTDTAPPQQQPRVTLTLGSPFPVAITGNVVLTFTPNAAVPADDRAIQFSTGGRTAAFTIPAGSTTAVFTDPNIAIQTGTVAGTITLTTTLQAGGGTVVCNCPLTRTVLIARSAPLITSVRATRVTGGISIVVTGFSTTREITQATFQFATAAGSNVQTTSFTVPVSSATYYNSDESKLIGSVFQLTQPFTIQGDSLAVTSVSVTVTNAVGASTAVSSAVQ